tara:strand:- start:7047 stop:7445 length:399 start_codon:yes stop_codon:yes gene_type:complete
VFSSFETGIEMDYQFERNEANEALATFSAGHEAIGHFLSSELKEDVKACKTLLDFISKIEEKRLFNHQYIGRNYQLKLSDLGIEVKGIALAYEVGDPLPEGTELYDQEQEAECGLFDFKMLLLDWLAYLTDS